MTLRWIRYQEKWAWGRGEVEFVEMDLPDDLLKNPESAELSRVVGEELEERNLVSNWSDKWRGVELALIDAPPREILEREIERAKARVSSATRAIARYEKQAKGITMKHDQKTRDTVRSEKTVITLTVRADGPFFIGSAKFGEHVFVTARMTTKVGARVAALGLAAACFASDGPGR